MHPLHDNSPVKPRSRTWYVVVGCLVALVVVATGVGFPPEKLDTPWIPRGIAVVAVGLAGWAVVRGRSDRRAYEADLVSRSAAEAVTAERLALARDLHDIVSHGLGLITTRAAVARRLSHIDPDDLAVALDDIEHTSRATTTELRRMLTLLRTGTDPASLVPLPGLADIPDVVADAERHHLTVDYTHNAALSASAGVAATIFQIVKEGLANTLRHAGPATATIRIERADNAITVAIADSGPPVGHRSEPATGQGQGLIGLSERVTALGGTLDSGQVGSGGFQLGATIPDPPTDRHST